jgi:hypothetical protein
MDDVLKFASIAGSAFATLSTVYFWFVRARVERPRLKVHLAGPVGADSLAAGPGAPPNTARSQFSVKAVVANYSALPNAVIGVKAWVKGRDGSWQPAATFVDEKGQPPFNLPPLHTVPLTLTATVNVPERPESAPRLTRREAALQSVAEPVQVKLELTALNERRFTEVLSAAKAA